MFRLLITELRSRRNSILGWGIGILLYFGLIILISPQIAEQFADIDLSEIAVYQAFGDFSDIGSPIGLIGGYFPLLALIGGIFGVLLGTGTLAGEEDNGTLEMIMALPLKRWQIVVVKAIAIGITIFLVLLIAGAGLAAIYAFVEGDIVDTQGVRPSHIFAITLEIWPFAYFFGMVGLLLGAYLPSRRPATTIGVALAILAYLIENLSSQYDALEGVDAFFPFHYVNSAKIFADGGNWSWIIGLIIAAVVVGLMAVLAFDKRNVTVGAWPWQRSRIPA